MIAFEIAGLDHGIQAETDVEKLTPITLRGIHGARGNERLRVAP